MKDWITKERCFYVFVALVLYAVVTMFLENKQLHEDLIGQQEAYEQLSDHSAKLMIKYTEQTELRAKAESVFNAEKGKLLSKIEILSDATFLIKEKARETNSSDLIWDGESKFVMNEIRFNDGPAVGYVLIFSDGRVVSKLYKQEINVSQVVSKDEDSGRYSVISKADFILKSSSLASGKDSWLNKRYPLKITGGTALIDPTERDQLAPRFFLWNPKINANINVDGSITPGIGVSISGYGKSKNDLDFKFIQIGLDLKDKKSRATLTPLLYRPFSSWIQNSYFGPGISYDNDGLGYFIGFQIGL